MGSSIQSKSNDTDCEQERERASLVQFRQIIVHMIIFILAIYIYDALSPYQNQPEEDV